MITNVHGCLTTPCPVCEKGELERLRRMEAQWKELQFENWAETIYILKAENKKLKEHFDNCNAEKIVSLRIQANKMSAAIEAMINSTNQYLPELEAALAEYQERGG